MAFDHLVTDPFDDFSHRDVRPCAIRISRCMPKKEPNLNIASGHVPCFLAESSGLRDPIGKLSLIHVAIIPDARKQAPGIQHLKRHLCSPLGHLIRNLLTAFGSTQAIVPFGNERNEPSEE